MAAFWNELQPTLETLQIPQEDRGSFRPRFTGDTTKPLGDRRHELEEHLQFLRGDDGSTTEDENSLAAIDKTIKLLEEQLALDDQTRERVLRHQREVAKLAEEVKRLETEIDQVQANNRTSWERLKSRRLERYLQAFDLMTEEANVLISLYEPLASDLQTGGLAHEARLSFSVRRRIETRQWANRGEELFDLRRASPVGERGQILHWAQEWLEPAWLSGNGHELSEGIGLFLEELMGTRDLRNDLRMGAELHDVAEWLFSLSHINLEYGLTYGGTELASLSPGTRGIVLLILYLGLDRAGSGPLMIDQPDENLDNQSVYDILVPYFREARQRRQVIIVTHNPNLVVNTDADQVIVASARRRQNGLPAIRYESGALETPARRGAISIRESVCGILEGGTEAFRRRERKYGFVTDRPSSKR